MRKMNLRKDPPVIGYSPTEREMFDLLVSLGEVSSTDLMKKWFSKRTRPYHARGTVNAVVTGLMEKVADNGEPFIIERSERRGPHPSTIRVRWKPRVRKAEVSSQPEEAA